MSHRVGVVGATGYTGSELLRILMGHPDIDIAYITSETHAGKAYSDVHPQFTGRLESPLVSFESVKDEPVDLIFLALPHGVSMSYVEQLGTHPAKIIDFSGDFRLKTAHTYTEWYGKEHTYPAGFEHAVYGMPELFYKKIKRAKLVANPGCFPTGAILALAPVMALPWIKSPLIIDAKTGVTGAGIKPSETTHFSNAHENCKAYKLKSHRHTIEIESILSDCALRPIKVQFTPHLLPVDRGIFSTIYTQLNKELTADELHEHYTAFYGDNPFVRLVSEPPSLKDVRGSNRCHIYVDIDQRTQNVIILSVIDNLVKGAAGQAVHNMNIMLGLDDRAGLLQIPLSP